MNPRQVLVLTVVHHPHDGRIRARQIEALLAAGWQVTYAAPWTGHGLPLPPDEHIAGLRCIDVPRARGRHRLAAQRAARRLLRELGPQHDLVLVHDPELVPTTLGLDLPPVVWDVHEDTAAAVEVRAWIPRPLRRPAAAAVTAVERIAERRLPLLLADAQYSSRFALEHPVVPNSTWVPDEPAPAGPGPDGTWRVVYLGSITVERGAAELVEVGRRLGEAGAPVRLEVMGPAHGSARALMEQASARGDLTWTGYLSNEAALARVAGALAGLSLLRDEANFRPSMPTKVVEYLAQGVPVITTPLPMATSLVSRADAGAVVPFGDVDDVAEAVVGQVLEWGGGAGGAAAAGRRGHALVRAEWDWGAHAQEFVAALERVLREAGAP